MLKMMVAVLLFGAASMLFGMSLSELNRASKEDLMEIKGIGETKADAIIQYRKKAPFKSFADVEEVKGVGPALVENIKNDVHRKESSSKNEKKQNLPHETNYNNNTKRSTK